MVASPIKHLLMFSILIFVIFIVPSFFIVLLLVLSLFGELLDSRFNVAPKLLRQLVHLHLLALFGGICQIFLHTHLRGIDSRLRTSEAYPDLLVEP